MEEGIAMRWGSGFCIGGVGIRFVDIRGIMGLGIGIPGVVGIEYVPMDMAASVKLVVFLYRHERQPPPVILDLQLPSQPFNQTQIQLPANQKPASNQHAIYPIPGTILHGYGR